jgi:MoaA/NifB/PqqE/SkfB family radical SAM enzyme
MLSHSREEIDACLRPLCTLAQYEAKLRNFDQAVKSFAARAECCEGLPIHLHLEPTGDCNLTCPLCPKGRGLISRTGHLDLETFERVFIPLSETLSLMIVSGFGEPLLNPATPAMIRVATRNGVGTFLNSNGTVLADKADELLDARLTVLNISLDGAVSQSTHQYPEQHQFENAVKGVETLRNKKDRGHYDFPAIHGQFILTEETVGEVGRLKEWACQLGIEQVKFKRKHQTMPGEVEREKVYSEDWLSRIVRGGAVRSAEQLDFAPTECSHPWDSVFLSCTGGIGICSFDPHQLLAFADAGEDVLKAWNGGRMREVRRWHAGRTQTMGEPCSRCNRLPGYLLERASQPARLI